ncbi:MAG: YHYH protein [Pseudomonadales bacterium]|nr:YHYH protein [Pseudomonadales bacterium]
MNFKKILIPPLLALPLILTGCGSSSSDTTDTTDATESTEESVADTSTDASTDTSTDTTTDTSTDATTDSSVWIINTTDEVSENLYESGTNQGSRVNVQSVETETVGDLEYTVVSATGIANYQVTLSQNEIDTLNARPKAATDFLSGATTAEADVAFEFGEDIGFNSNRDCETTGGAGYWPPGPVCPENLSRTGYFPNSPEPATDDVESGLGAMGYWVNGTSVYQWGDGQSYNNEGVWQTLAPVAEVYDVDVCGGHAANGDYHHHFSSDCLGEMVGDEGTGHSPIYGYAADGYAIYGPWYSNGVLAKSSWAVRDYDDASSTTGCGTAGVRDCVLVDEFDVAAGVVAAADGPTTSDEYSSLSGNVFIASTGFFYEDFYWDSALTNLAGEYLDQFNGHDSGDDLGYHYHVTVTQGDDGVQTPAFPYTIGPRFYGKLQDNSIASNMAAVGGAPDGGGLPDLPLCEADQAPEIGVCIPEI